MSPSIRAKNNPLDVRENCFNFKASGGDGKRLSVVASVAGLFAPRGVRPTC
jgi:hypothetical protein